MTVGNRELFRHAVIGQLGTASSIPGPSRIQSRILDGIYKNTVLPLISPLEPSFSHIICRPFSYTKWWHPY